MNGTKFTNESVRGGSQVQNVDSRGADSIGSFGFGVFVNMCVLVLWYELLMITI